METFSGSPGPKDVRAVIAGAAVAGQVQGMLWRWFAFLQNIYRSLFSPSFVELCGISWLHPPGARGTSRTWHRNTRATFDTALGPAPTKEKAQAGQQNSVSPVCTELIHEPLPADPGSSRPLSSY